MGRKTTAQIESAKIENTKRFTTILPVSQADQLKALCQEVSAPGSIVTQNEMIGLLVENANLKKLRPAIDELKRKKYGGRAKMREIKRKLTELPPEKMAELEKLLEEREPSE